MIYRWIRKLAKKFLLGKYNSVNGLDKKLEKYVSYDNGFYVELGANDGVTQSNSLYFERHRKWRGVLIEPSPHNFLKCRKSRSSKNKVFCAACVSFDYREEFVRIAYSNLMSTSLGLPTDISDGKGHARSGRRFLAPGEDVFEFGAVAKTLNDLLVQSGAPKTIDFLSLDVEGAELEVLKGVDHEVYRFKYILVECRDLARMSQYLASQSYHLVDSLSEQDYLFAAN